MKRIVAILAALQIAATCSTHPVEPEPGCEAACQRMRELGCEEGNPTPEGATCEEICIEAERSGLADVDTKCIVELEACGSYDVCTDG
jgi:hypothetical protein